MKWLGEIPGHWGMKRWRFLMSENTTKNSDCKERLQLQFRYGDIVRKTDQSEEKEVLDTISKYTVVEADDIMINGLNLNYDFISQRVAQVKEKGVITSAYVSLRPTNLANSRYYTYFLKSMDAKKMFHGMGTGIRLTLSYNELKNQFIPCPSIKEQEAIANYLDTATAKIDAAIAQQQKMIDLLNERKQIIINNAVTHGLNPNVKMKDSGVEWIGEIPEHWEVFRLKFLYSNYKAGPFGSALITNSLLTEGNILVYTPEHVAARTTEIDNNLYLPESRREEMQRFFVQKGDVVFPIVGSLGRAMVVTEEMPNGIINQRLSKFEIDKNKVNIDFFMWVFGKSKFYESHIKNVQRGSFIVNLTKTLVGDMPFVLPPLDEQKVINAYINKETTKIDDTVLLCNHQIALLQERKQIIINEVVTGKVKVI